MVSDGDGDVDGGGARERAGANPGDWVSEARLWVEADLSRRLRGLETAGAPSRLVEAMEHALLAGGKRLRPALVRLFAEELGGALETALPPASAIELLHTYSLVHDDLPCMDDDDLRRGRPTVHVAFGEDFGVLVGDALQTLAFEACAETSSAAASVACLARAAGAAGMVGGQVLDLHPDQREEGLVGLERVHELKTAALFSAACELGAIAAGAVDGQRTAAADFGRALGLCFQAVDDVLDVTGDASTLGKTPGKDAALDRNSSVAWLGLEGARAAAARLADQAHLAAQGLGFGPEHRARRLVDRLLGRER